MNYGLVRPQLTSKPAIKRSNKTVQQYTENITQNDSNSQRTFPKPVKHSPAKKKSVLPAAWLIYSQLCCLHRWHQLYVSLRPVKRPLKGFLHHFVMFEVKFWSIMQSISPGELISKLSMIHISQSVYHLLYYCSLNHGYTHGQVRQLLSMGVFWSEYHRSAGIWSPHLWGNGFGITVLRCLVWLIS